ncbi:glycosyltransferase [Luteimonas kalidii]|uniref:Glycosyltransferase n=1 Tax=Luteimonas kalidii TaxID=3042025 RepID=A0ABT6JTJ4_9GAMM|nr:glycosyltransferase [Luteimonas kalidii]MDH5833927.1 glycosyltransferase [Luteimonas kalidii]
MKILALTNLYPNPLQPHRAAFNRHRFRFLAEHHALRLIAPVAWRDEWALRRSAARIPSDRRTTNDGIPVEHPRYWYTPGMLRSQYGRFFEASVRGAFDRAVREFAPDIVLATWAYPDGWAAVRLARRHGLPVAVLVHGSDVRRMDEFAARRTGTRDALRGADGVIAVSADLAARVVALGAAPDRVATVLDGVDRTLFRTGDRSAARQRLGLGDDRRHLLYIGNLLPVKGVDVLLEACRALDAQRPDWCLHLVGDGAERARLEAQAQALGIAGKVVFHGARPHADLPDWLRAADLFVLPSRSEGIPNVLLEASACGTPYVASRVGGIPEIASLGAGVLVPPEQPQALAEAIGHALEAPPAQPADGPRDRREAVSEIARFLARTAARTREPAPLSRSAAV